MVEESTAIMEIQHTHRAVLILNVSINMVLDTVLDTAVQCTLLQRVERFVASGASEMCRRQNVGHANFG